MSTTSAPSSSKGLIKVQRLQKYNVILLVVQEDHKSIDPSNKKRKADMIPLAITRR